LRVRPSIQHLASGNNLAAVPCAARSWATVDARGVVGVVFSAWMDVSFCSFGFAGAVGR